MNVFFPTNINFPGCKNESAETQRRSRKRVTREYFADTNTVIMTMMIQRADVYLRALER